MVGSSAPPCCPFPCLSLATYVVTSVRLSSVLSVYVCRRGLSLAAPYVIGRLGSFLLLQASFYPVAFRVRSLVCPPFLRLVAASCTLSSSFRSCLASLLARALLALPRCFPALAPCSVFALSACFCLPAFPCLGLSSLVSFMRLPVLGVQSLFVRFCSCVSAFSSCCSCACLSPAPSASGFVFCSSCGARVLRCLTSFFAFWLIFFVGSCASYCVPPVRLFSYRTRSLRVPPRRLFVHACSFGAFQTLGVSSALLRLYPLLLFCCLCSSASLLFSRLRAFFARVSCVLSCLLLSVAAFSALLLCSCHFHPVVCVVPSLFILSDLLVSSAIRPLPSPCSCVVHLRSSVALGCYVASVICVSISCCFSDVSFSVQLLLCLLLRCPPLVRCASVVLRSVTSLSALVPLFCLCLRACLLSVLFFLLGRDREAGGNGKTR